VKIKIEIDCSAATFENNGFLSEIKFILVNSLSLIWDMATSPLRGQVRPLRASDGSTIGWVKVSTGGSNED